ncbi:hypothetical protein IT418_00085 [bacterium]|nr:hypothetical protein [bacterium]
MKKLFGLLVASSGKGVPDHYYSSLNYTTNYSLKCDVLLQSSNICYTEITKIAYQFHIMNTTDFWYKLVDMTKSGAPLFSIGGIELSEKHFLWIIGIVLLIILVLIVRGVIMWVLGSDLAVRSITQQSSIATKTTPTTNPTTTNVTAPSPTPATVSQVTASNEPPKKNDEISQSPQELLADHSNRKRSLNDFVTPDAIHSEVLKQTLNNDFPYQTMKPAPTKVGAAPATTSTVAPPASTTTFGTPATTTLPPIGDTPIVKPVAKPTVTPITQPAPAEVKPVAEVVLPPLPSAVEPKPAAQRDAPSVVPAVTPEVKPTTPVESTIPEPVVTTPPAATPAVETAPPVPAPVVPPTPETKTPVGLPPLPQSEPRATMVVGVADAPAAEAVTAKQYNPTDPVIP